MSSGLSTGFAERQLELALVCSSPADDVQALSEASQAAQKERRLRRMLARKQQKSDLSGMAACYIQLGDLSLSHGDSEEAGEHYRRALALSREAHESRQALARL